MTNKDYSTLNKYLGNDSYAYLIIGKNKGLEPSELRTYLFNKFKEIVSPEKFIRINVNYISDNHINLQSISKSKKSNSLLVRRDVLIEVLGSQLEIDYGIAKKVIFIKERRSINNQAKRKADKTMSKSDKNKKLKENVQAILDGSSKYLPKKEWIKANTSVLRKKSTVCEKMVYNKLSKSLKNRIKTQTPFTINGNLYFADICIKCKKIIIEVDGGYHELESQKNKDNMRDSDFASIGYKTLRIKNEDVMNRSRLSEFINDIINTPNCSKQ